MQTTVKINAQKSIILIGLIMFVFGAYLAGGLYPFNFKDIQGDVLHNWWLKAMFRDIGAALAVVTIIIGGLRAVRAQGKSFRKIAFPCVGFGVIAFFIILHCVAYFQIGKILNSFDFSDVIANIEKILERKDLPESKRRVLLLKLAETLYLQSGERIEVFTDGYNVGIFQPPGELIRFKRQNDLSRQLSGWIKKQSRNWIFMWLGVLFFSIAVGLFSPLKPFLEQIRMNRIKYRDTDETDARKLKDNVFVPEEEDKNTTAPIDVFCVGHACYDLIFSVENHPAPDEKVFASSLIGCGGGPAANAAIAAAKLGCRAAFAGYLGNDLYGQKHFQEFVDEGVNTGFVIRGTSPTPLSAILVKTDGKRTLVNYRGDTKPLAYKPYIFSDCHPKVMLFDGHEPDLAISLVKHAQQNNIISVLDAGSAHKGTRELISRVDHVVASQKFSLEFTGEEDPEKALIELNRYASSVIITLGEKGLVWKNMGGKGRLGVFSVKVVDTTGAGDAFHGAFAAGLSVGKDWTELLLYSSAVGALSCIGYGGRSAIPDEQKVQRLLKEGKPVVTL